MMLFESDWKKRFYVCKKIKNPYDYATLKIIFPRFMKKALAMIIIPPLIFTSCFYKAENTKIQNTESASGENSQETEKIANVSLVQKEVVGTGDTVGVDYIGTLEDGTIFDSSIEEFAKKSTNYSSERTYEPLTFTVGAGQMIKGFDD